MTVRNLILRVALLTLLSSGTSNVFAAYQQSLVASLATGQSVFDAMAKQDLNTIDTTKNVIFSAQQVAQNANNVANTPITQKTCVDGMHAIQPSIRAITQKIVNHVNQEVEKLELDKQQDLYRTCEKAQNVLRHIQATFLSFVRTFLPMTANDKDGSSIVRFVAYVTPYQNRGWAGAAEACTLVTECIAQINNADKTITMQITKLHKILSDTAKARDDFEDQNGTIKQWFKRKTAPKPLAPDMQDKFSDKKKKQNEADAKAKADAEAERRERGSVWTRLKAAGTSTINDFGGYGDAVVEVPAQPAQAAPKEHSSAWKHIANLSQIANWQMGAQLDGLKKETTSVEPQPKQLQQVVQPVQQLSFDKTQLEGFIKNARYIDAVQYVLINVTPKDLKQAQTVMKTEAQKLEVSLAQQPRSPMHVNFVKLVNNTIRFAQYHADYKNALTGGADAIPLAAYLANMVLSAAQ